MTTLDEEADIRLVKQTAHRAFLFSLLLMGAMAFTAPLSAMFLGGVLTKVLLMGAVSPLFVIGYTGYRVNAVRIAEGKTSLSIGRYFTVANDQHEFNQALNIFLMAAGALLIVGVAFVDLTGR